MTLSIYLCKILKATESQGYCHSCTFSLSFSLSLSIFSPPSGPKPWQYVLNNCVLKERINKIFAMRERKFLKITVLGFYPT